MTKKDLVLFLFVLSISATSLIRVEISDLLNMCFVMFFNCMWTKRKAGFLFVCF